MSTKITNGCLSSAIKRVVNQKIRNEKRCFSANAKVWVDKDTKVICQGFTGKQVSIILLLLHVSMDVTMNLIISYFV